jgi:hypothetical protein
MDPERIQKLTEDVLAQLGAAASAGDSQHSPDLEARVSALERAVLGKSAAPAEAPAEAAAAARHPSHFVLRVVGGVAGEPCILEPDQPCTHSRRCQSLGY